jgi:Zn-dependent protease with chaperone function
MASFASTAKITANRLKQIASAAFLSRSVEGTRDIGEVYHEAHISSAQAWLATHPPSVDRIGELGFLTV